jgi:hypothetical protein
MSLRTWLTYGWSKDGAALDGMAPDDQRRLMLGRIELATAKETKIADLGPAPSAAFDLGRSLSQVPSRGFSLTQNAVTLKSRPQARLPADGRSGAHKNARSESYSTAHKD